VHGLATVEHSEREVAECYSMRVVRGVLPTLDDGAKGDERFLA
jgi:hypothetical protein